MPKLVYSQELNAYGSAIHVSFLLVAVACLETIVSLPLELNQEIEKRLESIIPPTSVSAAKEISNAGDLAVPFLVRKNRNAKEMAMCVRTLAMIGTSTAIEILTTYLSDDRVAVTNELNLALMELPHFAYGEKILTVGLWGDRTYSPTVTLRGKKLQSSRWPYVSALRTLLARRPFHKVTITKDRDVDVSTDKQTVNAILADVGYSPNGTDCWIVAEEQAD